jgi:hypothetical protein
VQVKADGVSGGMAEVTFFYLAIFGASETNQGVVGVEAVPIVLEAFFIEAESVTLTMLKGEALEDDIFCRTV